MKPRSTPARTAKPRRTAARPACVLAALAALALLVPATASAHAQLEGTVPARGATVAHEPAAVIFRYDEPVEGTFGAIRVFDAAGRRVDEGAAFHPDGDGPRLGVHLRKGLPDGTYTATYRVISADSHPVSGGFVFSIGHPGAAPRETVAQLAGRAGGGPVTETAFGAIRAIQFGAIGLALGALTFLLAVWLAALAASASDAPRWHAASTAFVRRLRRWLVAVALAGAVSAALGIVLQGATGGGTSFWAALDAEIVRDVLHTRFGTVWGLAVIGWALVGVGAAAALRPAVAAPTSPADRRPETAAAAATRNDDAAPPTATLPRPPRAASPGALPRGGRALALAATLVPAIALVLVPAFSGHASVQSPRGVMLPANLLHVLAMSVWLGGLAVLLVAVPAATRRLEAGPDRTRLLAALLLRFSPLALGAVIVLAATGLAQAIVDVRTPAHLLDSAYGRAVLIKIVLLLALVGLGAYQRRRSLPRLRAAASGGQSPGRAGLLVRRALRAEVALIVVVLGVTGALASYPPSTVADTGPFSQTLMIGPQQLQITVDPARAGVNEIHLYLLDARTGTPFDGAKEVDVTATETARSIGPLDEQVQRAGPGHYIAQGATLAVAGGWRLAVTMRVSAFDEYVATVKVPVR